MSFIASTNTLSPTANDIVDHRLFGASGLAGWSNTTADLSSSYNPFDTPRPTGCTQPHDPAPVGSCQIQSTRLSFDESQLVRSKRPDVATTSSLTSPSNTMSPSHAPDRNLRLSEYLDPDDRVLQQHPPNVPFFLPQPSPDRPDNGDGEEDMSAADRGPSGQDPVFLGMLSEAEAQSLVKEFHDRFNHHIAVLDQRMHTLHYMRHHTIVLLSVVLAAASKLYRKDLWPQLLAHANTVLDRALLRGGTHISLMQSLMILTYTKAPADTSAWRRIGMAIRMGYQMRLHIPRNSPLPEDLAATRVLLNAERTWYCLFCFDRGLSQIFGLPYSIRLTEIGNCEAWAREHVHLGPSVDMHLAASIELCRLKDQWRAIFDSQAPSPSYCETAIDNLKGEAEAMYSRWFNRGSPPPGFDQTSEQVIAWCMLDFMFTLKRQHYELNPSLPMRLDACLSVASQIVDEIDNLGKLGVLGIMQDTASCMTSSLGLFFHKVFLTATLPQKSLMIAMLQRVLSSHQAVMNGDDKSAPAHVLRCIKRILGAIRAESRAGSPHLGEAEAGMDMTLEEMFGQFEDIFAPVDGGIPYTTGDEQFWQMLFSAQ